MDTMNEGIRKIIEDGQKHYEKIFLEIEKASNRLEVAEKELNEREKQLQQRETQFEAERNKFYKQQRMMSNADEANKAGVTANQGRSSIHCFFDAIKIIQPADTEVNSELVAFLSKTPFWVFIKSCLDGTIDPLEHKNYGRSIDVILPKYNRTTNKFSLGGGKVGEISDKDVAKLLGLELKDGMLEISQNNYGTNREKSSILQKYFEKGQRPKKSTIEFALKKAIKYESMSDVARLVIVHLLACYFFTSTSQAISWNLVHLCENLDEIGNYNWAQAINARLSNSLKNRDKSSVSGCISLVAYWFCEKTNIIDPKEGKKDAKPGLAKWNLQVLNLKWEGTEAKDGGGTDGAGNGGEDGGDGLPMHTKNQPVNSIRKRPRLVDNVSNEHSHDANQTPTYAPTQTQFHSFLDVLRESDRGRNEQFTTLVNDSIRDLNTQLTTQIKSYLDELKEIDRRRDEQFTTLVNDSRDLNAQLTTQIKSYLDELREIDRRRDEQFMALVNAISALSNGPPPPCVDRSKCTKTKYYTSKTSTKPLVLKELRKCWDDEVVKGKYNEFNTLLLDDSPYKALLNPAHTGVFPTTYDGKEWDDELGTLQTYLQNLATAENIPAFVSEHPFGQGSINEKTGTVAVEQQPLSVLIDNPPLAQLFSAVFVIKEADAILVFM
ncbi:hypothetical protein Q3G72_010896 [Acer saccharum]|nr:hypothetical protein Q3G72_010896 [Acer saccharum]